VTGADVLDRIVAECGDPGAHPWVGAVVVVGGRTRRVRHLTEPLEGFGGGAVGYTDADGYHAVTLECWRRECAS